MMYFLYFLAFSAGFIFHRILTITECNLIGFLIVRAADLAAYKIFKESVTYTADIRKEVVKYLEKKGDREAANMVKRIYDEDIKNRKNSFIQKISSIKIFPTIRSYVNDWETFEAFAKKSIRIDEKLNKQRK